MQFVLSPKLVMRFVLGALFLIYSAAPFYCEDSPTSKEIGAWVEQQYDSLFQLYRHLHSNPELTTFIGNHHFLLSSNPNCGSGNGFSLVIQYFSSYGPGL